MQHMFAIFSHFPSWSWNNLPASLTDSAYMTLDTAVLTDTTQVRADITEVNYNSQDQTPTIGKAEITTVT